MFHVKHIADKEDNQYQGAIFSYILYLFRNPKKTEYIFLLSDVFSHINPCAFMWAHYITKDNKTPRV